MRPLNKQAEQTLIAAIEKAAELVNAGSSPNDAIIKSATASNIPAGHINLMVHAYNTGRTTKQREQGEDALEKAADFQLADVNVVMDALYPKHVKTAGEVTQSSIVSTEYAVSPTGFLARRNSALTKQAAATVALPANQWTPPPRDEKSAAERVYSKKMADKRAAEELRRQASAAYQKAAASMEKLCSYFRVPGSMTFGDAVREVSRRLGNDGEMVLRKVAAVYPHVEKQAATKESHFGDLLPVRLVAGVLEDVAAYNLAQSYVLPEKTAAANWKKTAPEFLTGSIMFEQQNEPLTLKSAAKEPGPAAPAPTPGMSFGNTMATLGGIMGQGSDLPPDMSKKTEPTAQRQKAYASLSDADHEQKLQQIKSRGVLNDLILNDPVISGYDPHEVASAYNQIAEMAPSFTDSGAAMQSLLRKRLEAGQFADFDVKQMVELEKLKAESRKNNLESQEIGRALS